MNPGSRGHAPLTKTAQTRPRARLDALRLGARVALDLSYASGGQVLSQACPRAHAMRCPSNAPGAPRTQPLICARRAAGGGG